MKQETLDYLLDDSRYPPDEDLDFTDNPEIEPWEWKYARPLNDPKTFLPETWDAYREEWKRRHRKTETGPRESSSK